MNIEELTVQCWKQEIIISNQTSLIADLLEKNTQYEQIIKIQLEKATIH